MLEPLDLQGRAAIAVFASRNEMAQQHKNLTIPELLFGMYTLLWPRRTLRRAELENQVDSPTIARRCRRKSELKQYQQPEKLPFFKFVHR